MKPVYRSSNLIHYPVCPKKFHLSTQKEIERTRPMRDGLLFEGYLFGFKDSGEYSQFELEGRRLNKDGSERKMTDAQLETLERVKNRAELINNTFQFNGESFVKFSVEFPDFIIQGEADFIGEFIWKGQIIKGIVDLKYTGDIERNWNSRNSKVEFFQSVMYTFLELARRNKEKDLDLFTDSEPLPFFYLVVENNDYDNPLFKLIIVKVTRADLQWLWSKINQIHKAKDLGYPANDSQDNCLGQWGNSRCNYLQWCDEGRELISFEYEVEFSQLNEA